MPHPILAPVHRQLCLSSWGLTWVTHSYLTCRAGFHRGFWFVDSCESMPVRNVAAHLQGSNNTVRDMYAVRSTWTPSYHPGPHSPDNMNYMQICSTVQTCMCVMFRANLGQCVTYIYTGRVTASLSSWNAWRRCAWFPTQRFQNSNRCQGRGLCASKQELHGGAGVGLMRAVPYHCSLSVLQASVPIIGVQRWIPKNDNACSECIRKCQSQNQMCTSSDLMLAFVIYTTAPSLATVMPSCRSHFCMYW